jgi:DNA end-binding protein Ku
VPRTIWSGAISFGLVTVPIHVASATEKHSIQFHQFHLEDMGRVCTRKVCELEDREVSQGEIGKRYELSKDNVVPISDAELCDLPLSTAKAIEIQAFGPLESIDPIRIAEGYYLALDGAVAAKPYKLFVPSWVLCRVQGAVHIEQRRARRWVVHARRIRLRTVMMVSARSKKASMTVARRS